MVELNFYKVLPFWDTFQNEETLWSMSNILYIRVFCTWYQFHSKYVRLSEKYHCHKYSRFCEMPCMPRIALLNLKILNSLLIPGYSIGHMQNYTLTLLVGFCISSNEYCICTVAICCRWYWCSNQTYSIHCVNAVFQLALLK